ncbi:MAG: ABC transporter ATP-binding protein [Chloroflexota bacterium]
MIHLQGLTKVYKGQVHALRGIDLTIGQGMFGLLGPNGAGKTTLMRIMAGLIRPTDGTVTVFGNDISTASGKQAVKEMLGYLPQELGLYPNLSASEFLDYMAILKGITNQQERRHHVEELIELVRLTDAAERRIKTLSGGMKHRVGIAQAMIGNPKLLIVDEPTVGLDPEERIRIRNILSTMAQRCTVILSTHVIEDIGHSSTNLAIINKGEVLFQGAPLALIERARGKVWTLKLTDEQPSENLQVVSTLQLQDGIQYRVLGEPESYHEANSVEPSLEDGYMLMMQTAQPV